MTYSSNEEHNDFGFISIINDTEIQNEVCKVEPILDKWIKPFMDNLNRSLGE